jgi:hypothetical protein
MVVGSVAVAVPSPPPLTVTLFVTTWGVVLRGTRTRSVMGG